MKKLINLACSLALTLALVLAFAVTAYAETAAKPSIDYTGAWSDDGTTLTLTGKVDNPDQKFYSGAVALEYDPALFDVKNEDITAKDKFQIVKADVDPSKGRICTDLAYFDNSGGLAAGSTPTEATAIKLKLKSGKTKNDVTRNSVKLAETKEFIDSLGTSYSGGPVTIYGSKNKTDDTITKYGKDVKDNPASCTVTLPVDTSKQVKSIEPVKVSTTAGTKPTLPNTVNVTYADGHTEKVSVTWDDIPSSDYSKEGTFKVNGTVAGTSLKAEATVTVNKPTSSTTSTTTTTKPSNGQGSSNNTSKTGDNVRALTFMGILLGASVIVMLIVLFSRKNGKRGE